MASPSPSWPWLPIELIERILAEVWALPLTPGERTILLKSVPLVSRTWTSAFMRVSSIDVYIFSTSSVGHFLRAIRAETASSFTLPQNPSVPDDLCRSLNFRIDRGRKDGTNTHIHMYSSNNMMGDALSFLLYDITTFFYVPNLRRVTIEFVDWGFDDLLDHCRLASFPDQIEELEIKWSYSSSVSHTLREHLKVSYTPRDCFPVILPGVKRLKLSGASAKVAKDYAAMCPNLEMLLVD